MIKVIDPNGDVRYPFGEFETLEEKAERLEKELKERDMQMKMIEEVIAEVAKMVVE
mgnify:FL=1